MISRNGDRYANKITEAAFRNSSKEVNRRFMISSSDRSILFELGKEIFYQMTCFVNYFIVITEFFSVFLGGITTS